MTEQHVEHEPGAVAEGEDEAERFAGEADVGEHGDAGGGKGERERVAAGADAEGRQRDGSEELDGADRRQW